MPPGTGVLTVEFKINFVSPAIGDRIIARARVLKPGRTLVLTQAEVFAETAGKEKLIAVLLGTMMAVQDRDDVSD
jgi:acyl-coenzyme A thioesterase PaaI-like protein